MLFFSRGHARATRSPIPPRILAKFWVKNASLTHSPDFHTYYIVFSILFTHNNTYMFKIWLRGSNVLSQERYLTKFLTKLLKYFQSYLPPGFSSLKSWGVGFLAALLLTDSFYFRQCIKYVKHFSLLSCFATLRYLFDDFLLTTYLFNYLVFFYENFSLEIKKKPKFFLMEVVIEPQIVQEIIIIQK